MKTKYTQEMINFIDASPTAYHVIANGAKMLDKDGFSEYSEKDSWKLWPGMKGYVIRNSSAMIAFALPRGKVRGFRIYSAHSDSPCFRLKENPEVMGEGEAKRLNVEKYGGMILSTWLDRPLSVAGRVFSDTGKGIKETLVNIDKDLCIIPNLAIHMNPDLNKGYEYKPQTDMLPIVALGDKKGLMDAVIKTGKIKGEVLGSDLFLYVHEKGTRAGLDDELVLSPRLDDQACVFGGLKALTSIDTGAEGYEASEYINICAIFDNEEVGSGTRQGAESTFLEDTLVRISEALSLSRTDYLKLLADSFAISADNAHAVHPAGAGKADMVNKPVLNGGVVLKFSGSQSYATDGFSAGFLRKIAKAAGVKLQNYANNSDIRGGSTLGNISTSQVSVPTADIGLAQLAMHSAVETMGASDIDSLVTLINTFYEG